MVRMRTRYCWLSSACRVWASSSSFLLFHNQLIVVLNLRIQVFNFIVDDFDLLVDVFLPGHHIPGIGGIGRLLLSKFLLGPLNFLGLAFQIVQFLLDVRGAGGKYCGGNQTQQQRQNEKNRHPCRYGTHQFFRFIVFCPPLYFQL